MKGIDPTRWKEVSPLLDELLEVDATQRGTLLARIESRDPNLAVLLRDFLAREGDVDREAFLEGSADSWQGETPDGIFFVGKTLGRYSLDRLIGAGGMGAVYQATHLDLGKQVAIKTLHARFAMSQSARQRFLREGRAAARIRHPNVADVYDVGVDGAQPYLVIELLEGEDLGSCLQREGQLSVQRAADFLLPIVAGVHAAHALGIVHRDLKPENIFLCNGRNGITPKVLDFGIAKLMDQDTGVALTGAMALLGTPHYMSPEQAQGKEQIDARSDQYALGVIAYQAVTGQQPLRGVPLHVLIQCKVTGNFPRPIEIAPALPDAFEKLILRAMAREPERRFPTTGEFGRALYSFASRRVQAEHASEFVAVPRHASWLLSATVPSGPYGTESGSGARANLIPIERWHRWRMRWLVTAALLAIALLVVGLTRWRRIEPQRAEMIGALFPQQVAEKSLRAPPLMASPGDAARGQPPAVSSVSSANDQTEVLRAEPSGAQREAAAEALFDEGQRLFHEHKSAEACERFEQSRALDKGIGISLYLGECYRALGRAASAWALFREAASMAQASGQDERAAVAHDRFKQLEPQLAKLTLVIAPEEPSGFELSLDGMSVPALSGVPFPVDPGTHVVRARAPGFGAWSASVEMAHGPSTQTVYVPQLIETTALPR